jgi:tripartite-type tricarboxylate transporter receptor subunit TctC
MKLNPITIQKRCLLAAMAAIALCNLGSIGYAQSAWPTKPITLVVTYPPGGGADGMARLIAPKMGAVLGQSVIVENRPGAGGQLGATAVAKANADGYTLLFDASSFAVNPSLYPKLPYDSSKAFKAIGVIALFPNVVLVNPQFPAKNIAELTNLARSKKEGLSYASSGNGSAQHLAGALFEYATKVDMVHVPYKGGGPAINDVMGGQVPLFFGNIASTLQFVQSGKLRALAVTSAKRASALPDVPTLAEAGVQGAEINEWNALFAPSGTPEPVIEKIADALQKAMETAEVKARIALLGGEIQKGGPKVANDFVQSQMAQWAKLVKAKNIAVE